MIFDTHTHYDDEQFEEDREEILLSMKENGVGAIANMGASMRGAKDSVALAKKYPFVYAAVGIHPDHAKELNEEEFAVLQRLATEEKVVAIGEIGLDYYWDEPDREIQKKWFRRQLDLAKEVKLPVVIHSREAAADTIGILKEYDGDLTGVIHCYSYTKESAREFLEMGYSFGIGGVLTFKNAKKLKEAVSYIPMDRIMLETDCPYLAPEPSRGKRNSSLYIPYVVQVMAQLKGISEEEVIRITSENTERLFGI